jgi:hypothetical protein
MATDDTPKSFWATATQIASVLQSIAVMIAACVGGWWAVRTYEFEHPRFYEEGIEAAGVPLFGSIEVGQISGSTNPRVIPVRVTLEHSGHLTEIVALNNNPLWAAYITPAGQVAPLPISVHAMLVDPDSASIQPNVLIPPSQKISVICALPVQKPGLYLLQFDPCAGGRWRRSCVLQQHLIIP